MTHEYTLLVNGTVLTMDGASPADPIGRRANAVAIAGDRILAVETDVEVRAISRGDSHVVDLGGRTVIPGFQDPHAHPLIEGLRAGRLSLVSTPDLAAALRAISRASAETLDPDAWLEATYDHNVWPERRHPTRDDLDRVAPDRPVVLEHVSGHAIAVNSLALALAGITAATPDRPGVAELERDEHGEPTGVVHGTDARAPLARALPPLDPAGARRALDLAARRLLAHGVTAVGDAAVGVTATVEAELAWYAAAADDGTFPLRLALLPALTLLAVAADEDPPTLVEIAALIPPAWRGDRIRVVAGKLFADGAMTTRGAWLREPYADEPATQGRPAHEPADLAERIRRAHAAGWQIATHAIGDAAVGAVLDAYEATLAERPRPDHRHRVDHAMVLPPDLVARMAALGVTAVVQPEFVAWAGDVYRARLGPDRAARLLPYAELLAAGVPVAFSSDRPVVGGAPLDGVRSAIRHAGPSGVRLSDAVPISAAEALHAWTAGAARAAFDEGETGRLEVGYRADLTILSADPTGLPTEAWRPGGEAEQITVEATIVGGRLAWGELDSWGEHD
jgi:predicted amidohydrolase YtcJ